MRIVRPFDVGLAALVLIGTGLLVHPWSSAATSGVSRTSGNFRIFFVNGTSAVVMMNDLTISNGLTIVEDGAGIRTTGMLTLTNCTISGNTANVFGGGINHLDGVLFRAPSKIQ